MRWAALLTRLIFWSDSNGNDASRNVLQNGFGIAAPFLKCLIRCLQVSVGHFPTFSELSYSCDVIRLNE